MGDFFDYKGYTAEKLERLCDESNADRGSAPWIYWTSECYSSGKFLRKYGWYPPFLPLNCYSNHGVNFDLIIPPHEIENDAAFHLVYNEKKVSEFKKYSNKPCYPIIAPLPWLRKKNNWVRSEHAKGTLAFFQHTTPHIGFVNSVESVVSEYIKYLKKIPDNMQPVCVCLHMHDIHNGIYKFFLQEDIPVYTAGSAYDIRFAQRFYAILNNFSWTTGTTLGSNVWYSVEAGIPFFLYGKKESYYNVSDANVEKGLYESFYKTNEYERVSKLFTHNSGAVTLEQKNEAEKYLGINTTISRHKLSILLYISFFKIILSKDTYVKFLHRVWKKIRNACCNKHNNGKYAELVFYWADIWKKYFESNDIYELSKKLTQNMDATSQEYVRTFISLVNILPHKDNILLKKDYGWTAKDLELKNNAKTFISPHSLNNNALFIHANKYGMSDLPQNIWGAMNGKIVVDGGAFTGDTAFLFSILLPKSKIYSFEPQKSTFEKLQENVTLNEIVEKTILINKGLGDTEETLQLFTGGAVDAGGTCNSNAKYNKVPTEYINITTLDVFFQNYEDSVGLIKLDIEGFEKKALEGAKKIIQRDKPVVVAAIYHNPVDFFEIKDLLLELNPDYKFMIRRSEMVIPMADLILIAY